jgi:putative addiction module killer protein
MTGFEPISREVVHYVANGKDFFEEWLAGLNDFVGKQIIIKRVSRLAKGNFGDHRPIGSGVFEIRIHFGPGYRVYYGEDGPRIVLLLCGGDKGTQQKDISRAQDLWANYRGIK